MMTCKYCRKIQMFEYQKKIEHWMTVSSYLLGKYYDLASSIFSTCSEKLPRLVHFVLAQLFLQCHLTSESIIFLLAERKEWDASILLRSVMEGTAKYLYILQGNKNETLDKAYEFWCVLPEISDIKHSDRVKDLYTKLVIPQKSPLADLVLDEQEHKNLLNKYSKADRKKIEQRWAFSEILKSFENTDLESFKALFFEYGMCSHLAHMDAVGVGMTRDRMLTSSPNRDIIQLAHIAKIAYSICYLEKIRTQILLIKLDQKLDPIFQLDQKYADLYKELLEAEKNFYETEYPEK